MSTKVHSWNGPHQFPGCYFHFRGVFRFISHSCAALQSRYLFRDALYAFLESKLLLLLLLHKPIALLRNLGCRPWFCEPLEQFEISVLRNHSVNAIFWHNVMGDDCKWICLQKLQSLKNCNPWSCALYYFNQTCCILNVFPISFVIYILRNSVIIMKFLFIWDVTERIQRCEKDCLSSSVVLLSSVN